MPGNSQNPAILLVNAMDNIGQRWRCNTRQPCRPWPSRLIIGLNSCQLITALAWGANICKRTSNWPTNAPKYVDPGNSASLCRLWRSGCTQNLQSVLLKPFGNLFSCNSVADSCRRERREEFWSKHFAFFVSFIRYASAVWRPSLREPSLSL